MMVLLCSHQLWLSELSHEMQSTLSDLLVRCVEEGRGEGGGGVIDPRKYPQQILCLAEQVLFTERCEAAITEGRLAELLIELESQLDSFTNADISVSTHSLTYPPTFPLTHPLSLSHSLTHCLSPLTLSLTPHNMCWS